MKSKNKNGLTIMLIIVIVIIVGIIGFLGYEVISTEAKEKEAQKITDEFDDLVPTISESEYLELQGIEDEITGENGNGTSNTSSTSSGSQAGSTGSSGGNSGRTSSGGSYYRSNYSTVDISGLSVYGTISIPATNIKYSIFDTPSTAALDRGVAVLYTANGVNRPGNTVIAGHNYRNRSFFSRNKNLKSGDTVIIKDVTGVEVTYVIYYSFTTTSIDASFYQRDTGGKREITLSTCTDNGTRTGERLIIYAKEK